MTMSVPWSMEEDEIFIEFVKSNEALYNPLCPEYKDTHFKCMLWCEIGKKLNRNDFECSRRWCYIRDYYIRRKNKDVSCGEAAKKRFTLLSFLDKYSKKYTPISEIGKTSDSKNLDNTSNSLLPTSSSSLPSSSETRSQFGDNDSLPDEIIKFEVLDEEDEEPKMDTSSRTLGDILQAQGHILTPLRINAQNEQPLKINAQIDADENDMFFSAMAKIVKKLPKYEQVKLRMEIGTLVGTAELRCIEQRQEVIFNTTVHCEKLNPS